MAPLTVSQTFNPTVGEVGLGVDLFSRAGVIVRVGYPGQFASDSTMRGGGVKVSVPFLGGAG
jgi:hypothetical protein